MRSLIPLFSLVIALAPFASLPGPALAQQAPSEQQERAQSDALYQKAQTELARHDYSNAVASLESYVEFTRTHPHRPERVFWAIDQIGHVHLGVKRDPERALRFFRSARGDARLSELDRAAIDQWISVAEEWKATEAEGQSGLRDAGQLFLRGSRYFNSGLALEKKAGAGFARADYGLASGYLRRFALLHDKDPRIGEVLYMLGKIRGATRADPEQWSDNFYLKEVVRRFPHSELARRSFELLQKEARDAFHPRPVPEDLATQLGEYEELSRLSEAPR